MRDAPSARQLPSRGDKEQPLGCRQLSAHEGARRLLSGAIVEIAEWHCTGRDPKCPPTIQSATGFEVAVTRRGAYTRETRGQTVLSHAGVATFSHPDDVYRIGHPVPGGDVCSVFRIPEDGVRALLSTVAPEQADVQHLRFPIQDVSLDGHAYLMHRLAVKTAAGAVTGSAPLALAAEEQAMAFLELAVRRAFVRADGAVRRTGASRERGTGLAAEYVRRAHEVIARRFHERLTLGVIADAVGCSPYHLSHLVTAHDGVPMYQLVVQLRLRAALELVLDSRVPLTTVALDHGFASQSHFGGAFRREFGVSPGAVRRSAWSSAKTAEALAYRSAV